MTIGDVSVADGCKEASPEHDLMKQRVLDELTDSEERNDADTVSMKLEAVQTTLEDLHASRFMLYILGPDMGVRTDQRLC